MILRGEKVILRPITLADAPRFVKWLNNPEVYKFLQIRQHLTLKKEKEAIKKLLKDKNNHNFAILAKNGLHIGSVSLKVNPYHNHAVFGIFIGEKDFWNKGMGSEAGRIILEYGFKKLKLHRVELGVLEYNPRAMKVYKKLGFRHEGVKRDFIKLKNKFYDDFLMGILDREWKKLNNKKK